MRTAAVVVRSENWLRSSRLISFWKERRFTRDVNKMGGGLCRFLLVGTISASCWIRLALLAADFDSPQGVAELPSPNWK